MDEGYLKIYRKMMSWEWYTDIVVKTVFLHCLMRANYQDTEWNGIKLKRGQFITSYKKLSEECGTTIKQTRRAIWALCRTHEIEYEGHSKYSMITVVEYDSYQTKGTMKGTKEGNQRASKGQQIINKRNIRINKEKDTPEIKNPWVGIRDDGEEYCIDVQKYYEWNREHGIEEDD